MSANPMEQLPLNLTPPRQPEQSAQHEEMNLESMSIKELEDLYEKKVGIKVTYRHFGEKNEEERKTILIEGILNKSKALDRLQKLDDLDKNIGDPYRNQH